MQREPSDSSTTSNSRLRRIGSRIRRIGSKQDKTPISPISDTSPVQKFVQELDATETAAFPASDSVGDASDDPSYQQLRDNVRRLRGASLGVNGVDSTFSVYSRCREQSLELCKSLVQKSNTLASASSFDVKYVGDKDGDRHDNDYLIGAWLSAIHDFKKYQEGLLEHMRESITATYQKYEPDATTEQVQMMFSNRVFRGIELTRLETGSNPLERPETIDYWPKYVKRLRNYDQLKLDILETENFCGMARSGKGPNISMREYDIAINGDTILEFTNSGSDIHPVLRFRVSSYMLIEASPYFARILAPSISDANSPLELLEDSPPPPLKQTCRDGAEVKVYRMPQLEQNKWEALTTLLHAAHMHNDQIPRQVKFHEFVSIAEVCLRYQCTAPLEMAVEYRWLPQWIHKANEDSPDGFLLISYVFGLRRLFTRTSKSAILNISGDKELQNKDLWPREVKDKIAAVREAKIAQIYTSCADLMKEYIKKGPNMHSLFKQTGDTLTTTPKCPKGLHQCDAANLGWLMLVYDELAILPIVMDTVNGKYPFVQSNRSIRSLVNSLRKMPSAPQLHSGICDYAPAFRSTMNDVYNSITGLSLRDVSGVDGWALSKRHDLRTRYSDDAIREVFELPAPVVQKDRDPVPTNDEVVGLRILGHLDDLKDLHATAMVNKMFYTVYKKHELTLLRNLVRAGKQRSTSGSSVPPDQLQRNHPEESRNQMTMSHATALRWPSTHKPSKFQSLPSIQTSEDNFYDTTPPTSPRHSYSERNLSPTEVEQILWPNKDKLNGTTSNSFKPRLNVQSHASDSEKNAKYLSGDIRVDKSLVIEGRKHLRDEHDRTLRMGPQSTVPQI